MPQLSDLTQSMHACFLQLQVERCQQQRAQSIDEELCPDVLLGTEIVESVIGTIGR